MVAFGPGTNMQDDANSASFPGLKLSPVPSSIISYAMAKIRRNAQCPCGSGKKYKKCCGDPLNRRGDVVPKVSLALHITEAFHRRESDEAIRVAQQGRGRPIVSTMIGDYTGVAAGNTIHWSKKWKTFTDFLLDYIKRTLGSDWGNSELVKPLEERHPILQWYDAFSRYQASHKQKDGELYSGPMTGVACCYLGLAYSLYLLKHNVELQARLVARLKDIRQFQGAYYELIVANCLIRAGFALELEDEVDQKSKHCEFSARSQTTGKRYWIEAKMRSVPGVLGKTINDGSTSNDPTSRLSRHIGEALRKPAPDERIIFIDLNTEPLEHGETSVWLNQALRRLEARERDLKEGQEAYVFVTNMAFHRALNSPNPGRELFAHGLGLPDFGKPGEIRLQDWYRQKQKHIDAHNIMDAFRTYPQVPETFDGRPASEAFDKSQRLRVGETYFFEDVGDEGVVGTVTSVAVVEAEKRAYVAIAPNNGGNAMVLTNDLSDAELDDYRRYGDAYFGEAEVRRHECKDVFDLYEWMVSCYSKTPRERLLDLAKDRPDIEYLRQLDQADIVLELCEAWAMSANMAR